MQGVHIDGRFEQENVPNLVTELQNIVDRFVRYSKGRTGTRKSPLAATAAGRRSIFYLQAAKMLDADHKRRDFSFSTSSFADPVWDMMLSLFVAELEGKPASVNSAGLAEKVPTSTALRYLAKIQLDGIVERESAQFNRQSSNIALGRTNHKNMILYLEDIEKIWITEINYLVYNNIYS